MAKKYSVEIIEKLANRFAQAKLYRPMHISRYEPGTELSYEVIPVESKTAATVKVLIDKFIGGGYAGQVYKVKILENDGDVQGLEVGSTKALKILIPPSGFARIFRNALYWIGFQAPFQQQVNPTAARAGALWQKFIRRAAKIRFGNEECVKNVHGTFVDNTIGSCGEISDWTEGRTWRLEVDDHMDLLKLYKKGKNVDESKIGSAEYLSKKKFMADFVKLLHDLGAHEFARQYEWSTCKSQPNVLKRYDSENDPTKGLVVIDFRAGLTLLPILPMSPGDFKLIFQGLGRGSLVQFDRGDTKKLEQFVNSNRQHFEGMAGMLEELKTADETYRNSIPDITHNHIRLLYSGKLWRTIFDSAVTSWKIRNLIDENSEKKFRSSKIKTFLFCLLGFIPFLGKVIRKFWGRQDWRKHYLSLFNFNYFGRAIRGKITEKLVGWYRAGRTSSLRTIKLSEKPWLFFCNLPLSILPAGLHRFMTDRQLFKEKLHFMFVRPFKLYFSTSLREQWMRNMVEEGKKKHILTDEDANTILSQLKEKYIQRYLISLVVHLMTLPLTQIVSFIVAAVYYKKTGDEIGAGGILVLFQIIPVSPGSIARGSYAVGIAIYDRSFKNYNIAVFLSFFKYIGYLGFPIQMTNHYPAIARFMASHWATEAVHIVPVFGERGALLEHWVFCLFYNWPLTIRRRMARRAELRTAKPSRYWQVVPIALLAGAVFASIDWFYANTQETLPTMKNIWYAILLIPILCGAAVTLFGRGTVLWKRFISATIAGLLTGGLYSTASYFIAKHFEVGLEPLKTWPFRLFFFAVFACIGAIITELKMPDPGLKNKAKL